MNKVNEIYLKRAKMLNQFDDDLKWLLRSQKPIHQKMAIYKKKYDNIVVNLFLDDVEIRQVYEPDWLPCNCNNCKLVLTRGDRK
jgi:hypothetical protein